MSNLFENYKPKPKQPVTHVYLDEAGDMSFYARGQGKRRLVFGENGTSRFFILGMLRVDGDAKVVKRNFSTFLQGLKVNPYFSGVNTHEKRSNYMQYWVHANKDLPEIRMKVFEWLLENPVEYSAAIYRKDHDHFESKFGRRERKLYAKLLARLATPFCASSQKTVFHLAKLGGSTSDINIKEALEDAQNMYRFDADLLTVEPDFRYDVQDQDKEILLGAADYFSWAIQRALERKELRFANKIDPKVRELVLLEPGWPETEPPARFTSINGLADYLNKKSPPVR